MDRLHLIFEIVLKFIFPLTVEAVLIILVLVGGESCIPQMS